MSGGDRTPAPWDTDGDVVWSGNGAGPGVCMTIEPPFGVNFAPVEDEPVRHANAKLIAAAPELLAALQLLRGWLVNDDATLEHLHDEVVSSECAGSIHENAVRILVETAERAIAKAEGRS